jgi:isopentenyldiphosphate isomerase
MHELDGDSLRELRRLRQGLNYGWSLTQDDLDDLDLDWHSKVQPSQKDVSESFAVTRPDGSITGVSGPRWLFHLLGLCHRASHVGLATQNGMVLLQRRAVTKADWPDAWDMAVAGHVPVKDDGSCMSFEEGALKETEEELGLLAESIGSLLVEGRLVPVGAPYFSFDVDEGRNPPFYNAECQQIFGGTLTPEGLSQLKPDYEELSGVYLCPPEKAWDILARGNIAGGLRTSLPRYLDWLAQITTKA